MNVLKNPSFFRPSSRPSSPAPGNNPAPGTSGERSSRPSNKLSLSSLMRTSSSQLPAPGPINTAAPLVQDGSYLEMLSLKLSEAVSKALAQPVGITAPIDPASGKRPIPNGRGTALGTLIASELNAAHDPHLHRAVLRTLQRPLTVLLTNLSAQLLPSLSSPSFHTMPTAANTAAFPNSVQQHALSIATFAEELLRFFDDLSLGLDNDIRGDGLKPIRDGLVSLITRVTNPLVTYIRNDITPLVEALEMPAPIPSIRPPTVPKYTAVQHPSIVSLNILIPVYARALTGFTTSVLSHATLANLLISVLWKGIVAISHRQDAKPSPMITPDASPLLTAKRRRGSPTAITPPVTPPASRFILKLPPSRPPSPPATACATSAVADCRSLYDLLVLLPRPSRDHDSTRLACEAVDEAFEGLRTLPSLLDGVKGLPPSATDLNKLTTEIPTLIALAVLLRAYGGPGASSIPVLLALSEEEYRKGCLSGFARAEECAVVVVNRVMDCLFRDAQAHGPVLQWMRLELEEIQ